MRQSFASIDKLDNGYVVTYPEAKKTVRSIPSPLDQVDPDQIELLFNLVNMTSDDGDEAWKGDQLDERRAKIRERIEQMKAEAAARTIEVWVVESREFFCSSIQGVTKALEAAEKAKAELEGLQQQGVKIDYSRGAAPAVMIPFPGMR